MFPTESKPESDGRGAPPRTRHLIAPAMRRATRRWSAFLLVVALPFSLLVVTCAKETANQKTAGGAAETDTAAYRSALALSDTTERVAALQGFLDRYPESVFRAGTYSRVYDLMAKTDGERAASYAREKLETEKDPVSRGRLHYALYTYARDHSPQDVPTIIDAVAADASTDASVYNMIAWDLVETKQRLDDAIRLSRMGVEKAGNDSDLVASTLDTEGWAHFEKGDYPAAVTALERARTMSPEPNEEVDAHMARAYDAAGMKEKARDLYMALMVTQEDPAMRGRLEGLTKDLNGSPKEIFAEIDRRREKASYPAKDFTLKDYEGKAVRLADFQGKVVLLNFWHPT